MLIKIANKDYDEHELETLAKAGVLNIGQKNDPASTTLTAPALHGPFQGNANQFGLFSYAGVRPQRFSTLVRPDSFLDNIAQAKSNYTNEILEIMTGATADSCTNATGFCGNPPTVGQLKVCQQTFSWGDYYVKTDLNAGALLGQLRNRADVPAELLNAGPRANTFFPDIMYRLDDTQSQFRHELFRLGISMERQTEQVAIQGVAATQNNTYCGWFTQFKGLDGQIKTGYTDAVSGYTCPAVDSAVVTWNTTVDGTDTFSRSIVEAITDTVRGIWLRADKMGFGRNNVTWGLVMRYEAFAALIDQWACVYSINRCAGTAESPNNRDSMAIQQLRMSMLNGSYLLVDNIQIPVIFSEGIPQETLGNNYYKSDIYLVPFSWSGMPLLKMEYYPMDNQYTSEYMNAFGITTVTTLNNGLFLVGKRDTGLCLEWHFQARMRLILETPFLAARVDDLWYKFYEPIRNALPGASLYADGGISYRS